MHLLGFLTLGPLFKTLFKDLSEATLPIVTSALDIIFLLFSIINRIFEV